MKISISSTQLNYTFVYSRIFAFCALYFSIYAYSSLGELAFFPMYFALLAYTTVFLLLFFIIVMMFSVGTKNVKPPVGQELTNIEKKSGGWWAFLYNAFDLGMFWFFGMVWTRNGFPEMAGWMDIFFWIAVLMGVQALYFRLWVKGIFN